MNYKDGKDIMIFIEEVNDKIHQVSLELLSEARRLKTIYQYPGDIKAIYFTNTGHNTDLLYQNGAEEVLIAKDQKFAHYQTNLYAESLTEMIQEFHPDILLIGGSHIGRDLAPRVSAKVKTGLTADATHLAFDEQTNEFLMTRPAFGGNINATIICPNHYPKMATIRPNVFLQDSFESTDKQPIKVDIKASAKTSIQLLEEVPKIKHDQDITKAKIVVSGGRGVSGYFNMLNDVAQSLKGEVGASRAVVDQGLAYKDIQVGQTGKTIRPTVYLACGISGAIQHTAGMDKSDLIIAINTDQHAPIFNVADLGIIGDAKEILPLLHHRLQTNNIMKSIA